MVGGVGGVVVMGPHVWGIVSAACKCCMEDDTTCERQFFSLSPITLCSIHMRWFKLQSASCAFYASFVLVLACVCICVNGSEDDP